MNNTQTFWFYIIISLSSIFCMKLSVYAKRENKKNIYYGFILLSFCILLFVNIFRSHRVGTDYLIVGNMYTKIVNYGFVTLRNYNWFGTGLTIICMIIGFLFGSKPVIFYAFIGFFTLFFLYKCFFSSCKFPTLSLVIYIVFCLYLQTFNQSRQMLAVSLVLYSLKFVEEREFKFYVITILLATCIHESAFIFLPLYFISNLKINKKSLIIYFILFLISYIGGGILEKVISYTKYSIYFTTKYNVSNVMSTYFNTFLRLCMLIICLLFKKEYKLSTEKKYNYLYHMIIICTFLQFFTMKYYFLGRLTTYFYSFYIILLPEIILDIIQKFTKNSQGIVALGIAIVLFCYYYVYYNSASGASGSGYSKYSTIFEVDY